MTQTDSVTDSLLTHMLIRLFQLTQALILPVCVFMMQTSTWDVYECINSSGLFMFSLNL